MFKSIATLTVVAAVATAFALPAHAIYVGNGLSFNGSTLNGTDRNSTGAHVLMIELPRE